MQRTEETLLLWLRKRWCDGQNVWMSRPIKSVNSVKPIRPGKREHGLNFAGNFKPECQPPQNENHQEIIDQEIFFDAESSRREEEDSKLAHEKANSNVPATKNCGLKKFESVVGSNRFEGGSEPKIDGQRRASTLLRRDGQFCEKIRYWISFGGGILWCLIMIAACSWYAAGLHSCSAALGEQNLRTESCFQCIDEPKYPECCNCLDDCEWQDFGNFNDDQYFYDAETWDEDDFQTVNGESKKIHSENLDKIQISVRINGESFLALIDTGSTHSFLNLRMAEFLRASGHAPIFGQRLNFDVADGSSHSSTEIFELMCQVSGRKKILRMHLFEKLDDLILIGMDLLKIWDVLIDPATKSLIFRNETWDPGGGSSATEPIRTYDQTGQIKQTKDPPLPLEPETENVNNDRFLPDEIWRKRILTCLREGSIRLFDKKFGV